MKKFTGSLMTAFILIAFMPASVKAMTEPVATTATAPTATIESAEANALMARLAEIKAMDKSNYKNLVDILDEMLICNVGRYAIVDLSDSEKELIKNAH